MRIILAYSGGLDTSVILKWLQERYRAQVTALIADVGQAEDLAAIARRAEQTGADRVVVADLRDAFAREFVFPAVQANAVYEGAYLMGTALARPLIARALIEQAQHEKADAVAHGATSKGNDQVRFELGVAVLAPDLKVIAPWREWDLTSRPALLDYARAHGIAVESEGPSYSMDANLMHISYEGLGLEDPWQAPDAAMFRMTVAPEQAPDAAEYVEIDFEDGLPTAVNGEALPPAALVTRLNEIGGRHGVGRVDVVENRFIGLKSRGVYETPGVTLLHLAHRAVESLTMDREVMHVRDELMPRFAEGVYNGFWFAPEMRALRAFVTETQAGVTGTARLKLYKGSAAVVGRKAPHSLYDREAVSFDTAGDFSGRDAEGFIRLQALRLRAQGKR